MTQQPTQPKEKAWKEEDLGAYITNVRPSTPDLEFAELSRIMGSPTSLEFCRSAASLGWIEYQAFRWIKDPSREKNWRDCIEIFDDFPTKPIRTDVYENGSWQPAQPLEYRANFMTKLLHLFGRHIWTVRGAKVCVICGRTKLNQTQELEEES